jgi:hypothetical protein
MLFCTGYSSLDLQAQKNQIFREKIHLQTMRTLIHGRFRYYSSLAHVAFK